MVAYIAQLLLVGFIATLAWYAISWPLGALLVALGDEYGHDRARLITARIFIALLFILIALVCFIYWKLGIFGSWGVALSSAYTSFGRFLHEFGQLLIALWRL